MSLCLKNSLLYHISETNGVCVWRLRWLAVDFEASSANCEENQTALTLALDKKDAAAVEQLLQLKADPNEAGRLSSGVLTKPFALVMFFILEQRMPVSDFVKFLELLKQHGADVDATQHGYTPLWMAAAQCRVEAVELLLKLKADPNKGKPPAKDVAKEYADSSCQNASEKQRLMAAFKDKWDFFCHTVKKAGSTKSLGIQWHDQHIASSNACTAIDACIFRRVECRVSSWILKSTHKEGVVLNHCSSLFKKIFPVGLPLEEHSLWLSAPSLKNLWYWFSQSRVVLQRNSFSVFL